ncbi:MAG: hypothetical protein HN392_09505 [Anaerolineae bacterium]|nr:hypothetical protein [Anaerolineae bacterium]MBT7782532.1 hypothetical protein [Anaerolineae bacterium]
MRYKYLRSFSIVLFSIIFLSLSACLSSQTQPTLGPLAEASPAPPTATIQWFLPTATATPQVIQIATYTPVPLSGIGGIIATDDFSSDIAWNTIESGEGSVNISRNRITIAVKEPEIYLFSLRNEPLLGDFYLEIDAHPALCKGGDSYGLIFRASSDAHYKYALACDGTLRLEYKKAYNRPRLLAGPFGSANAPLGSPGDVRLGVWMAGSEMRFYLNDRFQFAITDRLLSDAGTIGVFAQTAPENSAMTVTFSNLVLHSVGYTSPTPTITPTETPVPTSTKIE